MYSKTYCPYTPVSEYGRLVSISEVLTSSLRRLFPTRFDTTTKSNKEELSVAFAWGDYPKLKSYRHCVNNDENSTLSCDDMPPVLQVGTVVRDTNILPSMIQMPMPRGDHLDCYADWAEQYHLDDDDDGSTTNNNKEVCNKYKPRNYNNNRGMPFGTILGLQWDNLINQLVWRGGGMGFLNDFHLGLRAPEFELDVVMPMKENGNLSAVDALKLNYFQYLPRWQGVVWNAEAERDAKAAAAAAVGEDERTRLPWANIKFSPTPSRSLTDKLKELGINCAGEHMSVETMARYKYHLDLGGSGGMCFFLLLYIICCAVILFE